MWHVCVCVLYYSISIGTLGSRNKKHYEKKANCVIREWVFIARTRSQGIVHGMLDVIAANAFQCG